MQKTPGGRNCSTAEVSFSPKCSAQILPLPRRTERTHTEHESVWLQHCDKPLEHPWTCSASLGGCLLLPSAWIHFGSEKRKMSRQATSTQTGGEQRWRGPHPWHTPHNFRPVLLGNKERVFLTLHQLRASPPASPETGSLLLQTSPSFISPHL